MIALLAAGCGRFTVASLVESGNTVSPQGRLLWNATAKLTPLNAKSGGGFVELRLYEDGTAIPTVRINLPPPTNVHYEAWLTNKDLTVFSNIGPLIEESQGTYYLGITTLGTDESFLELTSVLISRERTGQFAEKPTDTLLFGTLKITSENN